MKFKVRYLFIVGLTTSIAGIMVLSSFLDVYAKSRSSLVFEGDPVGVVTRQSEGAHPENLGKGLDKRRIPILDSKLRPGMKTYLVPPPLLQNLSRKSQSSNDNGISSSNMSRWEAQQRGNGEVVRHVNFKSEPGIVNTYDFSDITVDRLLEKLKSSDKSKFGDFRMHVPNDEITLRKHKKSRKGMKLLTYKATSSKPLSLENWQKFYEGIHQYGLYSDDDPTIDGLLQDIATQPIVAVEMKDGGTQLKLTMTFRNKGRALFKPMRFPRKFETLPNHFYFSDFERHTAEIAAFHLDRVLGFYRVPPTAGRTINMTYDIKQLTRGKLFNTFYMSPAGNVCFYGECSYYCDPEHAFCGNPDMLEGSFAAFLPSDDDGPRRKWKNPWKRSYSKVRKAYWEVYDDLCDKVRKKAPFNSGRRLLDLIDLHIFDFITGNLDRHHYETFDDFGNETFLLHLDNGRAFGKTKQDDMSVLAPVYQCCLIRYSTFIKLVKFYLGPKHLSDFMRESLKKDKVYPVLNEPHFPAMDRRVMKILKEIADCISKGNSYRDVIVDDSF